MSVDYTEPPSLSFHVLLHKGQITQIYMTDMSHVRCRLWLIWPSSYGVSSEVSNWALGITTTYKHARKKVQRTSVGVLGIEDWGTCSRVKECNLC